MPLTLVGYLLAAALAVGVAGCGDPNDTTILIGATPTPEDGTRTATPLRSPTPLRTATAGASTPMPIASGTAGVTATTASAATPTVNPTSGTPVPTATPGGPVDPDVQRIADDIVPFLANTALLTGGSIDATAAAKTDAIAAAKTDVTAAAKTDACPDGGSRLDDEKFPARTLTFEACGVADALGSFQFDGQVVVTLTLGGSGGGSIAFDFTLTDRTTNHAVDFLGTLPLTVDDDGFILNGALAVTTPEGSFTLNNDDVTITANRKLVSGSGSITDDDDNFGLQTVAFTVTRRGAASNLTVTFDDASVQTFTLDLATGEITPTS